LNVSRAVTVTSGLAPRAVLALSVQFTPWYVTGIGACVVTPTWPRPSQVSASAPGVMATLLPTTSSMPAGLVGTPLTQPIEGDERQFAATATSESPPRRKSPTPSAVA